MVILIKYIICLDVQWCGVPRDRRGISWNRSHTSGSIINLITFLLVILVIVTVLLVIHGGAITVNEISDNGFGASIVSVTHSTIELLMLVLVIF